MSVDHFPGQFRVGVLNQPLNGVTQAEPSVVEPKFLVLIVLRGKQVFSLDGSRIELCANPEDDNAPVGFATLIKKNCHVQFQGSWGAPFRKIAIAGPPDWFTQIAHHDGLGASLPNFPQAHLERQIWQPGRETVRLTNQIIFAPPEDSGQQTGLFRMSRALEILRRIPEELYLPAGDSPAAGATSNLNMHERIRLYILDNLTSELSLDHLEAQFGLNRRSIQRRFKHEYGIGLSEFIRKSRLNTAKVALQREGITISQAAYLAGYSSVANFSTAFRREYDIPPASLRNRAF